MHACFPLVALLLTVCAARSVALEIQIDGKGSRAAYFLMTEDREVLGTFWSPFTGESDYGFKAAPDSQLEPVWSPGKRFVAVVGGTTMRPRLFVYRAAGDTLEPVRLPATITGAKGGFAIEGWKDDSTLVLSGLNDDSRTALRIEGTAAVEASAGDFRPAPPPEEPREISQEDLAGEHRVTGTHPDGTRYNGVATFRIKNGLVLIECNINGQKSYGTGLLEGSTLGVGLESGLAVYQVQPSKAGGWTLDGIWATQGSTKPNAETILIGNADPDQASVNIPEINGRYSYLAGRSGEPEPLTISGKGPLKTMRIGTDPAEGLARGTGFAMITPTGLAVFHISIGADRVSTIAGRFVDGSGRVSPAALLADADR